MRNTQGVLDALARSGMTAAQAVGGVTQMVQGQAVMLATDQVLLACAMVFALAAAAIWLAPKPARVEVRVGH